MQWYINRSLRSALLPASHSLVSVAKSKLNQLYRPGPLPCPQLSDYSSTPRPGGNETNWGDQDGGAGLWTFRSKYALDDSFSGPFVPRATKDIWILLRFVSVIRLIYEVHLKMKYRICITNVVCICFLSDLFHMPFLSRTAQSQRSYLSCMIGIVMKPVGYSCVEI